MYSFIDLVEISLNPTLRVQGKKLIECNTAKGKKFLMEVEIRSSEHIKFLIYKFDPERFCLFPYFADIPKIKKICDFFLFVEKDDKRFLFLIELKKDTGSPTTQLNISECFAQFLLKRIEMTHQISFGGVEIRKLGIKERVGKKLRIQAFKYKEYEDGFMYLPSSHKLRLLTLINAPNRKK